MLAIMAKCRVMSDKHRTHQNAIARMPDDLDNL
jgi:hypothetical protein